MKRRRARKRILSVLYRREFTDDPQEAPSRNPYVREVLEGIAAHREEIDKLIEARAEGWRLDRLHLVDRSILRLGIYELLYRDDVPPEVAIDEAVELAKLYGTERSGAFVNGILDRIWKESSRSEVQSTESKPEAEA